jgi:hypothetical protein
VTRRGWAIVPLALALLVVGCPPPAEATGGIGAGVGASPIELTTPAHPGGVYPLPDVLVVNTGNETSTYRLAVEELGRPKGRVVPAGWVRFDRNDFALGPGVSVKVPLVLNVAATAAKGRYASDIVVSTVAPSKGTGARVGAQAATALRFRVGGQASGAQPGSVGVPWEVFLAIGIAAIVGLLLVLARRKGYRIRLERRG